LSRKVEVDLRNISNALYRFCIVPSISQFAHNS
jgi:hypothetical protein